MKNRSHVYFCDWVHRKKKRAPLKGYISLTYSCDLNCIHCFCKGSEDRKRELPAKGWKEILDGLREEGCLWLVFTGGDPLVRPDFLELYDYARRKGFIVTIYTGAHALTERIISHLAASPPESVEITLNGITADVYEEITQVKGSFARTMRNIGRLFDEKIPFMIKTNCMKQNQHQIGRIKAFADGLPGAPDRKKHRFQYDPMILPRLNGDLAPTKLRLTFEEIEDVRRQDKDMWKKYCEGAPSGKRARRPAKDKDREHLYHCEKWKTGFTIDPFGFLKMCPLTRRFGVDLKQVPFRQGFYEEFPKLLKEKFKTKSRCRSCRLRPLCGICPATSFLETGDEEAPAAYYCGMAEKAFRRMNDPSIVS
ncbi:MAG: radical SAM protein [Pseudomonadota bacterium]